MAQLLKAERVGNEEIKLTRQGPHFRISGTMVSLDGKLAFPALRWQWTFKTPEVARLGFEAVLTLERWGDAAVKHEPADHLMLAVKRSFKEFEEAAARHDDRPNQTVK